MASLIRISDAEFKLQGDIIRKEFFVFPPTLRILMDFLDKLYRTFLQVYS